MKKFKKIVLIFLAVLVLIAIGGYFYFTQKFTPEENYLTVKHESGNVPIIWLGDEKNVLLVPIHFPGDTAKYYLQFDTGTPYTQFYPKLIKDIKEITVRNERAKTLFYIGNTEISSEKFKIFDDSEDSEKNDTIKIIGTIGADILENRKAILDFKEGHVVFNVSKEPEGFKNNLIDFPLKKRHIIIPAVLKGKERKFLYDSGTSAYELLTNKEEWEELRLPNSKVVKEEAQSWNNVITTFTTQSNDEISFKNSRIPLKEVTYTEGFSQAQYFLMKFSGMTGMLGNKIFLNNSIYIDCSNNKIGIK